MKKQEAHIKKAFIMMMLCIYAFGLIKPVLPLMKDAIAHTFFKASHMSTVHYENGKYHLHMELSDEVKKSESKQNPVFSNYETLAFHVKSETLIFKPFFKVISEINSPYINISTDVNIPAPLLPPEC
jgi:hypothetical protein